MQTFAEGNRFFLTISEAFPKDAGNYSAVARNMAGESTSTCSLSVKVIFEKSFNEFYGI